MNRTKSLVIMANRVFFGLPLNTIDIYGLAGFIKIDQFKPEYLPGPKTISGSPKSRKDEIFRLAEAYWGVKPQEWLNMENGWLKSSRARSGSQETKGKDQFDDVISAELLIRFIATIAFVDGLDKHNFFGTVLVRRSAISSLNMAISEAILKGQTRIEHFGDKTIYACLKNAGIMIGIGGGKYLPDPETSLPYLFQMLQRDRISPQVYF